MASIRRLYEMARSRGEPTWAMLDWAAQQTDTFTIKDLYKAYIRAGGDIGETSFHTLVNKLIAKPWKDDQEKYALSDSRPIMAVKRGMRGAGGAAVLKWGLDHPLREPPQQDANMTPEEQAVGDAMDRLEAAVGRGPLRKHMTRWRGMDLHQAIADIRQTVPRRAQMDALHVVSAELERSGAATPAEVQDAEAELRYAPAEPDTQHTNLPDAPGATSQRPAVPAKADQQPAPAEPAPEPEQEPEDPEEPAQQPGLSLPKQFFKQPEPPPEPERNPGREPEEEPTPPSGSGGGGQKKSPLSKFFKRK